MDNSRDYKVNRYVFLAIIIALAIFLVSSLIQFFTAFLLAIILYVLGKPLFDKLIKKRKWKKGAAALLIIIVSFFIILLPIITLVSLLYDRIASVVLHPENIMNSLKNFDAYLQQRFDVKLLSDKNIADVQSYATTGITEAKPAITPQKPASGMPAIKKLRYPQTPCATAINGIPTALLKVCATSSLPKSISLSFLKGR